MFNSMNEEDEIDVLGDFKLDLLLSKGDTNINDGSFLVSQNSDLLNCDYTIHPQWLLDRPSANPDNWYDTNTRDGLIEREDEALGQIVSTENSITDESGWTEKEKSLIERGIDIFGKSNERLSQFIGSKSASEVKYYLKNFYSEHHNNHKSSDDILEHDGNVNLIADVLDDNQIPTSIEEVIAAVSTAKPTVPTIHKKPRMKSNSSSINAESKEVPRVQPSLKYNRPNKYVKTSARRKNESVTKRGNFLKMSKFKNNIRDMKTSTSSSKHTIKPKVVKVTNKKNNQDEIKTVEITTGQGLAVPICEGEEIIKIKSSTEDSDTDTEINVELSDEECQTTESKFTKLQPNCKEAIVKDQAINLKIENTHKNEDTAKPTAISVLLNETVQRELNSLEKPAQELNLNEGQITDLEKVIHHEYFDGSPTKTPERYLKIRNHILKGWKRLKPNYLFKTVSRQGLKSCGDVNSFGRIHYFLEQIGAINFGCDQVCYYRPLSDMLNNDKSRDKKRNDFNTDNPNNLGARPRHKPKLFNDGEGGYTLSHDEHGRVFKHTVINQEPLVKHKFYVKKPMIRLIYCRPFSNENKQPYNVKMSLSALLAMDFHSHTSLTEVMGLVAGLWLPQTQTLSITHYEPCRNIASSATHCDMCPISQAKAVDTVHSLGLDILGWFHSHPTFAPEPSHQDLETQQFVQQWIGQNRPCIGVILSPFSLNGAFIASPLRCMIVGKKENFEDQFVPYKFKVDIETDSFVVQDFLCDLKRIIRFNVECNRESKVDFGETYFQDGTITFLEKFSTSVRMRIAKCGALDTRACDSLIREIKCICEEIK